jgi:hypothetical protein
MGTFIMEELKLDHDGAHALRRRFLDRHGTNASSITCMRSICPKSRKMSSWARR